MVVPMSGPRIGAAFRLERRFDLKQCRTKAAQHILDDMIAPDAQLPTRDLDRQMTIAEVPGDARKILRLVAADLRQGFGRGYDFNETAILKHQGIAIAQDQSLGKIEQKEKPMHGLHHDAAAVTRIEIEHHRVSGVLAPCAAWFDRESAKHGRLKIDRGGRCRVTYHKR